MPTLLERTCVLSSPTRQAPTLRAVLEELGITPFTPESVAQYKHKKMATVMEEIQNCHGLMQEVTPAYWERQVLCWLKPDETLHSHHDDIFLVKFFDVGVARIAVYVRWEKKHLTEARGVPDYVKAKAAEITSHLPNATLEVDELRSSERVYDPFLVVSYGEETYYVEVWDEPVFERQHT
jgi:hypothetical protein